VSWTVPPGLLGQGRLFYKARYDPDYVVNSLVDIDGGTGDYHLILLVTIISSLTELKETMHMLLHMAGSTGLVCPSACKN
jgi:hypothetical protein